MRLMPVWLALVCPLAFAQAPPKDGAGCVNAPLSQQRAAAVAAWLSGAGIDKARLTTSDFGSRKPLADNATEEGRAKNRRVNLVRLY